MKRLQSASGCAFSGGFSQLACFCIKAGCFMLCTRLHSSVSMCAVELQMCVVAKSILIIDTYKSIDIDSAAPNEHQNTSESMEVRKTRYICQTHNEKLYLYLSTLRIMLRYRGGVALLQGLLPPSTV